jgi:integrase
MAEGIRRRHSEGCNSHNGGRCNCNAGWEASVYLAREGRKLRHTFAREAEAKTWRADALAAANARSLRTPSQITVEQAAWLWLEAARTGAVRDRSGHHYKPGTLREYGRALSLRVLPEFGGVRLSELTRADLQDFVDRLLGRKLAASTIRNTMNPLQAIYRHAVRRELVVVNPTREVDLPAARGRREKIATASQAARLIAAVPDSDRAIWATAFYAGLRRGELQALRSSDIDLGRSEITVERSWDQYEGPIAPKSKAGVRTVPILAVLRDHLDARSLGTGSNLAFGRRPDEPFNPKAIADPGQARLGGGQRARAGGSGAGGTQPRPSPVPHVSRVPPHLRVAADRRRGQPEGDSGVHGSRHHRGDVLALRAPDAGDARPGPRAG